jgi:hypothetical protein
MKKNDYYYCEPPEEQEPEGPELPPEEDFEKKP